MANHKVMPTQHIRSRVCHCALEVENGVLHTKGKGARLDGGEFLQGDRVDAGAQHCLAKRCEPKQRDEHPVLIRREGEDAARDARDAQRPERGLAHAPCVDEHGTNHAKYDEQPRLHAEVRARIQVREAELVCQILVLHRRNPKLRSQLRKSMARTTHASRGSRRTETKKPGPRANGESDPLLALLEAGFNRSLLGTIEHAQ